MMISQAGEGTQAVPLRGETQGNAAHAGVASGASDERRLDDLLDLYNELLLEEWEARETIYAGHAPHLFLLLRGDIIESRGPASQLVSRLRFRERMGELFALIGRRRKVGEAALVLDAGCGHGSESLLLALAGARVVGVDLVPERMGLARERARWWSERLGRALDIEFLHADIFRALGERRFDAVWMQEAIQHIHPAEKFLEVARKSLRPGGIIIISDSNKWNPVIIAEMLPFYWRNSGKLSWFIHTRYKDPETGQAVEMAAERLFSRGGMKRMLEGAGFEVLRAEVNGQLPLRKFALAAERLAGSRAGAVMRPCVALDRVCKHVPGLRLLGGTLTAVATPRA